MGRRVAAAVLCCSLLAGSVLVLGAALMSGPVQAAPVAVGCLDDPPVDCETETATVTETVVVTEPGPTITETATVTETVTEEPVMMLAVAECGAGNGNGWVADCDAWEWTTGTTFDYSGSPEAVPAPVDGDGQWDVQAGLFEDGEPRCWVTEEMGPTLCDAEGGGPYTVRLAAYPSPANPNYGASTAEEYLGDGPGYTPGSVGAAYGEAVVEEPSGLADSGFVVDPATGNVGVSEGGFVGVGGIVFILMVVCGLATVWLVMP